MNIEKLTKSRTQLVATLFTQLDADEKLQAALKDFIEGEYEITFNSLQAIIDEDSVEFANELGCTQEEAIGILSFYYGYKTREDL